MTRLTALSLPITATVFLVGCIGAERVRVAADTANVAISTGFSVTYVRTVGGIGSAPGEFSRPSAISLGPQGTAYVVDTGNERIERFSSDGAYIDEIGGFGWDDGQFNRPMGICARGGLDVWVADTFNRRIAHLNSTLVWLGSISNEVVDNEMETLGYPTDVAVSGDGWLWFTDRDTDRLRHLSPFANSGQVPYGTAGTGDLNDPRGLAIAPDGTIVVADTGNDRLAIYDRFGNRVRTWGEGVLSQPSGLDITSDGDIVIADTGHDRIVFVNRVWDMIGTYGVIGSAPGTFHRPTGVAVSRNGRMWVADRDNNRVEVFQIARRVDAAAHR